MLIRPAQWFESTSVLNSVGAEYTRALPVTGGKSPVMLSANLSLHNSVIVAVTGQ